MKLKLALCSLALLALALPARAALKVVATTSEYGALASQLGGQRVAVTTIAKPTEDPHFVDARPSQIVALNRADVLIEGGAELEVGWLPPLLEGARNGKILSGGPGRVVASEGIQLVDIPAAADRSQGDTHLAGNPHFMLDPLNARVVAAHIVRVFSALDPAGAAAYQANLAQLDAALQAKMKEWTAALKPFAGRPIVTYHPTWRYFARRFGLISDTYLEPKPGIPPSPPHLAEVMQKMKAQNIQVLLVEPYQPRKTAEAVASRTNAAVVEVCQFPGGLPGTDTYLALLDADVKRIAQALAAHP
ncbi:MAG TPA: metal ABC transporter substrate-binding protein [Thermoanaerobaculia bacterium]|nr:metal ABC transporter substrate-binding protein [Thermoanaerobaculia bacterium]